MVVAGHRPIVLGASWMVVEAVGMSWDARMTLVVVEMLEKCTKPMFLSLTILIWSINPNLDKLSLNCSSVMLSSRPPR